MKILKALAAIFVLTSTIAPTLAVTTVTDPTYYAAANETDIRAKATLACANSPTGGRVVIPAGTITITSALPVCSGLFYEGSSLWQAKNPSGQTTGVGGTILQGNGTFDAFDYNSTDLVTPPSNFSTFVSGMVTGFGLKNLTLVNFAYGIKIGALYNPGSQNGHFENIYIVNAQQWCAWFENDWGGTYINISANNCAVGYVARGGSGATALNTGNTFWYSTSAVLPAGTMSTRGLVTFARGSSKYNNHVTSGENASRTATTAVIQAATMANLSANITITDGTKFSVGMPVTVSSSVNGFLTTQAYFIASVAGNVITLTNTAFYGTAINATGNTAVNIQTQGFPVMEIEGQDAASAITGASYSGLDLEGQATALVLLQNSSGHNFSGSFISGISAQQYFTLMSRGSFGIIANGNNATFDEDSSSFNAKAVWNSTSAFLLQIQSELDFQATTGKIKVNGALQWDFNSSVTGRWYSQSPIWTGPGTTCQGCAGGDSITVEGSNYGYASLNANNANGNAGLAFNQGSANGSATNGTYVCGIVGTNTDNSYGLNTTKSGKASGDFICQTFFSAAFQNIFDVPVGTNNFLLAAAVGTKTPVTLTGTSGSIGTSDSSEIINASGTFTLTLPTCSSTVNTGRWLNLKSIAAQTVNSASSNVVPLATAAAGTAIFTASAGKFANLQCDGTNWVTMAAN